MGSSQQQQQTNLRHIKPQRIGKVPSMKQKKDTTSNKNLYKDEKIKNLEGKPKVGVKMDVPKKSIKKKSYAQVARSVRKTMGY